MTRREKLQENFEDALFALLMEEVAEQEGQRLLEENEKLKRDPESTVPPEVDRRCLKTIRRAFAKTQRRAAGHTAYRVFRQAAMVAVVGMLLFVTAFAVFPEVRVKTLNLLIEVSDVATSMTMEETPESQGSPNFHAEDSSTTSGGMLRGYQIPAVPDGFVLVDSRNGTVSSSLRYENEDGAIIDFHIIEAKGTTHTVDTEDADASSITIHGYEGLFIEEGSRITITWGDTDQATFVTVFCDKISEEDAMSLANEIIYIGSP